MGTFPDHPLRLRLLGSLEVGPEGDERAIELLRYWKRLALLVYLAALPRSEHVQRDTLMYLFWPDSDDVRARNALSQALYVLRKVVGPDAVLTEGDRIRVNPERVTSDLETFRAALEVGRFGDALALYRGDLLDGFHVAALPEFEEWMATERSRLRRAAVGAAWRAAAEAEAVGNREEALRFARRAATLAPLEEEGARRLMALHLRYGDRARAIQVYEALARRMEAELGIEPSDQTREAFEAIRLGEPPREIRTPLEALPARSPAEERELDGPERREGGAVAPGPRQQARVEPGGTHSSSTPLDSRWRPLRWASSGAILLAAFLVTTSVARDASPPVTPGALAVVNAASQAPAGDRVVARVLETLSGADFLSTLAHPSVSEDGGGAERFREEGIEAVLRLEDVPEGVLATLLRVDDGRIVGTVQVPHSLDEEDAADRIAGLAALHLDRRLASWGEASSVVPGYRAFEAYHDALTAWGDLRSRDWRSGLERAVALEPWFPLALLELAERELARTPPVDSLLVRVQAERPRLSEVEGLFLVYVEAGHAQDLRRQYDVARRLAEKLPERFAQPAAGLAVDLGRYEEALALVDRFGTERSILPNPNWAPSMALHGLGRHEEEWKRLQELDGDRGLEVLKVHALAALGRLEQLQSLLRRRGAEPIPGFTGADLNVRRGAIKELLLHGYPDEARILIDEGLRYLDGPAGEDVGIMARAWFLRIAGRLDDAERAFRESLARAMDEIPEWSGRHGILRDLGLIAAARGDVETALEYDAMIAALPEDPTVDFHPRDFAFIRKSRAQIHAAVGNEDEAVHLLTRALALGLSHVQIRTTLEFGHLRGNPDFDRLLSAPTF
jgi:DNA-binding SARP family transcriptional activator